MLLLRETFSVYKTLRLLMANMSNSCQMDRSCKCEADDFAMLPVDGSIAFEHHQIMIWPIIMLTISRCFSNG